MKKYTLISDTDGIKGMYIYCISFSSGIIQNNTSVLSKRKEGKANTLLSELYRMENPTYWNQHKGRRD